MTGPTAPPAVLVAGAGRCGSTMMMHVLAALGVPPVPGSDPGTMEVRGGAASSPVLAGHATKVLNAVENGWHGPGDFPVVTVLLTRNLPQQTKSMAKFLEGVAGVPRMSRDDRKALHDSLADTNRHLPAAHAAWGPVFHGRYEEWLTRPLECATALADDLRGVGYDIPGDAFEAAAAVVHDRTPDCRPDLMVEVRYALDRRATEATA